MNEKLQEIKEIHLDDLIPFQHQSSQAYEGDRLNQLVSSIERVGLMSPIIVRPVDNEKYEITPPGPPPPTASGQTASPSPHGPRSSAP